MTDSLFELLETASHKPPVFSKYTAEELWTDEHTSEQMLGYHLSKDIDASSRKESFINDSVLWISEHFELSSDSRIIDFGCGPGLYTSRFAKLGAKVTGIDFSSRSLDYAKTFASENGLAISYHQANYLEFEPQGSYDLITMIMCDYCALSPAQRGTLLTKFKRLLAPHGRVLLDVYSLCEFNHKTEDSLIEKNQRGGFWSKDPYHGIVHRFRYTEEKVSLDKYTLVESNRIRELYNWLQHFSPESLEAEILESGLQFEDVFGSVAGDPYIADASEFAVSIRHHD